MAVQQNSRCINAYILAADPTWIEASVLSYYDIANKIVVSYDENFLGWTGVKIPVEACLNRLAAIDRDNKMRYCPGRYFRPDCQPIRNDTDQRQSALKLAGQGADWVIQLDTDEILPGTGALLDAIGQAEMLDRSAIEWPMRVLFGQARDGRYLEVCARDGSDRFEYPGPIIVRPDVTLVDARRVKDDFLRLLVKGDCRSLQVLQALQPNEVRLEALSGVDAIIHNSWARSPASIRSKISSWGHSAGWKSWAFYYMRWLPTPFIWRFVRDFHPFAKGLWPALKPCSYMPKHVVNEDGRNEP